MKEVVNTAPKNVLPVVQVRRGVIEHFIVGPCLELEKDYERLLMPDCILVFRNHP